MALVFFLLSNVFSEKTLNKSTLRVIFFIALAVVIVFTTNNFIKDSFTSAWSSFLERLVTAESQDGSRIILLQQTLQFFAENPILGSTLSNFVANAGHIPHNAYSDFVVTNGIVGLLFTICCLILPTVKLYPSSKKNNALQPYYTYLTCIMNIFFYSASNEKMTYVLLILLQLSVYQISQNGSAE